MSILVESILLVNNFSGKCIIMVSIVKKGQGIGVQACQIIDKRLKAKDAKRWTDYRIAKELHLAQRSYQLLRDKTENPGKAILKRLFALAHKELGMTLDEFWGLL